MLKDIRYGLRALLNKPGFTVIATIMLALGIGANTAIFSVVNGVLLRPLPFQKPERLMAINEANPQQKSELIEISYPNFLELQAQSQSFEQIGAYSFIDNILTGRGEPVRVSVMPVSANIFPILGVNPAQGRTFLPEEDKPGGNPVVIVSHAFWQQRFGGEPLLNNSIILNDRPYTVVGIMPKGSQFPDERMEIWMPFGPETEQPFLKNRAVHIFYGLGRLKPGVSQAQAQAELETIFGQIQQQYPGEDPGHLVKVTSLQERIVGEVEPALLVLLGAVAFVLLIACANVANLMLVRAAMRQKEVAIRLALGASQWQIIRQLLTESLLVALFGGAIGLLLAMWGTDILVAQLPSWFPRTNEIRISIPVLGFTFALSLFTGILFGLVPAIRASRSRVNENLKEGQITNIGSSSNRLRSAFVIAEVALTVVLLAGAGLMLRSFWKLTNTPPGFQPANLLTMKISLPALKYSHNRQQVIDYYQHLPERLEALPGVQGVSAVNRLPISVGDSFGELTIENRPFNPGEAPSVSYRRILPNYFQVMGIPLKSGREFDARDSGNAPAPVIINENMALRYWGSSEEAIGKRIKIGPPESEPWLTIVGVVGDVHHTGLDAEPDLATFEPHAKRPWSEMNLLVRTNVAPLTVVASIQNELKNEEKDLLIEDLSTMGQRISKSVAPRRLNTFLMGFFAVLALLAATIGIYGVLAFSVSQRIREIGIRMAIGAQATDVVKMIIRQGMVLAFLGVGIGLVATLALTRFMRSLLFGISATDLPTLVAVSVLLLSVALLACFVPARRASKVDPIIALRYE